MEGCLWEGGCGEVFKEYSIRTRLKKERIM